MTTTVSIEGIECYSFHGCLKEEALIGGSYQVDVHIHMDVGEAVIHDDLSKTIDYVLVNKIVREQMAIRSKLIEHVGGRILKELASAFPGKKTIELKVIKFNPPVNNYVAKATVSLRQDYH